MKNGLDFNLDFSALKAHFEAGGSIFFVVPVKFKKKFRLQTMRIKKFEMMRRGRRTLVKRFLALFYAVFVGFNGFLLGRKNKALRSALLIYETMWRYIGQVDGMDLDGTNIRIIYVGRGSSIENRDRSI